MTETTSATFQDSNSHVRFPFWTIAESRSSWVLLPRVHINFSVSLVRLDVVPPFLQQRGFLVHLLQKLGGFLRSADYFGTEKNHQLDFARRFVFFLKRPSEAGNASEHGRLPQRVRDLPLDDASQNQCL